VKCRRLVGPLDETTELALFHLPSAVTSADAVQQTGLD
jgi:hypothetical protein